VGLKQAGRTKISEII